MKMSFQGARLAAVGGLLLAGSVALADNIHFGVFTPMPSSAGPTADEATPITFGNPAFEQRSIADRNTQLADNKPNSGNWDMITTNETGSERGRTCSPSSRPASLACSATTC